MTWNFNIEEAPKGFDKEITSTDKKGKTTTRTQFVHEKIWAATKCGKVGVSYCLEDGRWNGFMADSPPIAWAPLLEHPNASPTHSLKEG